MSLKMNYIIILLIQTTYINLCAISYTIVHAGLAFTYLISL